MNRIHHIKECNKKSKKLLTVIMTLCMVSAILLAGCSSDSTEKKDTSKEKATYDRDTSPGKVVEITLEEMENMLEQKQSFTIAFLQTDCPYCKEFEAMLEEYQKNHNLTMYEVILDKEPLSANENRAIIQKTFPAFDKTPGLFYSEGGKMESYIPTTEEDMTPENFEAWVQKYQMDKKQ